RALLEQRPIHVVDVLEDEDYSLRDLQRVGGYRTVLAVPMIQDAEAFGVLAMMRNTVSPFSDAEIEVVSLFARHAGVWLSGWRTCSRRSRANGASWPGSPRTWLTC